MMRPTHVIKPLRVPLSRGERKFRAVVLLVALLVMSGWGTLAVNILIPRADRIEREALIGSAGMRNVARPCGSVASEAAR